MRYFFFVKNDFINIYRIVEVLYEKISEYRILYPLRYLKTRQYIDVKEFNLSTHMLIMHNGYRYVTLTRYNDLFLDI